MLVSQRPEAVLLLNDGTLFRGRAIGNPGIATGEICFNTGMTGYQEIFTDPSYTGQIMTMASPHIGNYGVKEGEEESEGLHCGSGGEEVQSCLEPPGWVLLTG